MFFTTDPGAKGRQAAYIHFIQIFNRQGERLAGVQWFDSETLVCRLGQEWNVAAGFCFLAPDRATFEHASASMPRGLLPFVIDVEKWGGNWDDEESRVEAGNAWVRHYLDHLAPELTEEPTRKPPEGEKLEGCYRHFKGGKYRVLGLGFHTETKEALIIYHLEGYDRALYARPRSMWSDLVRDPKTDKSVPRFSRIADHG